MTTNAPRPPAPPLASSRKSLLATRRRRRRSLRATLAIGCSRLLARWRGTTPRSPILRFLKDEGTQIGTTVLQWYCLPWCRTEDLDAMQRWLWRFHHYRGAHATEPATIRRPLDPVLARAFSGLASRWRWGWRPQPSLRSLIAGRYSMPRIVLQGVLKVPTSSGALASYDAALQRLITRLLPSLQAAASVEDRAPFVADTSAGAWNFPRGPRCDEGDCAEIVGTLWRKLVEAVVERTSVRESPVGQQLYQALIAGDALTQRHVFEALYAVASHQERERTARWLAGAPPPTPPSPSDRLLALAALARWPWVARRAASGAAWNVDAERLIAPLAGVAADHPDAVLAILGCDLASWRAQAMISLVPALRASSPVSGPTLPSPVVRAETGPPVPTPPPARSNVPPPAVRVAEQPPDTPLVPRPAPRVH